MRISPRHLILVNGLTLVACLLHVLVHALELSIGEWHDRAVYAFVAVSFVVSVMHGMHVERKALVA